MLKKVWIWIDENLLTLGADKHNLNIKQFGECGTCAYCIEYNKLNK